MQYKIRKLLTHQLYQHKLKKRKEVVSLMPSIRKVFDLMGDDIVELSAENESLKNKLDSYDEKCLEAKSKAKL